VAWAEIIVYATAVDAELIREWINAEESVAWIVKAAQSGRTYTWKAVDRLDSIHSQEYRIWHKTADKLNIPSGRPGVLDADVSNPEVGWSQTLEDDKATAPWFGDNLPGPYIFRFNQHGKSAPNALGRSGFSWAADHFRPIGRPAHPAAKKWWLRLKRFIQDNSNAQGWPQGKPDGRTRSHVFKDALAQIRSGRPIDANP
jgi:hypothetical protein